MTTVLAIDELNFCTWRLTPWDARAFGFSTADISGISYTDRLLELFELVEAHNLRNRIGLCYFRHDANDQKVKKIALSQRYAITEFSLHIFHNDIGKISGAPRRLSFVKLTREDREEVLAVKTIARTSFAHGRFHEDPFVDSRLAGKRYELWIDDLIETANCYIFKVRDKVAGFFTYRITSDRLDLPLTGISPDARGVGGFFWTDLFSFIHNKEQVRKTKILVSGANTDVLNLYARLGFTFGDPVFGYHKHYNLGG